eukprot:5162780-Pyramimonas_sp.AAC.1
MEQPEVSGTPLDRKSTPARRELRKEVLGTGYGGRGHRCPKRDSYTLARLQRQEREACGGVKSL